MAAVEVFVDTAGFLALWDVRDGHHAAALRLQQDLIRKRRHFLTTEYCQPTKRSLCCWRATVIGPLRTSLDTIRRSEARPPEWIDPARFHAAATWFRKHGDKQWSFTDCVSFAVMHELRIRDAFTTDHHFRQAGFNPLLRA